MPRNLPALSRAVVLLLTVLALPFAGLSAADAATWHGVMSLPPDPGGSTGGAPSSAVRQVDISVPSRADYGSNVSGTASVVDIAGSRRTAVPGVEVQIMQLRNGVWGTVSDDITDAGGNVAVNFTSRATSRWRAAITVGGRRVYSRTVTSLTQSVVAWAARPHLDVQHGRATPYGFRILPRGAVTGQLQIAKKAAHVRWLQPVRATSLPGSGVLTQRVSFPTAGTWLVRGVSQSTSDALGSTTSVLVVTVT